MREILLNRYAKMRISSSPRTDFVVRVDGLLSAAVPADLHKTWEMRFVSVEVLIPRGARAEYGALSLEYSPGSLGQLDLIVPYSSDMGPILSDSLAALIDVVRAGLTVPYAKSVMSALQMHGGGVFPPGKVVVREAAHGDVGSSESLFNRLAEAVIDLLYIGYENIDEGAIDRMRRILL